jgi:hypothetical protein
MHVTSSPQQMGWFDGKGIDFHPGGLRINLHECHGLWSTLEC